jgi:CheY-like chemotaxis protein
VELLGGKLAVESSPGIGSTFSFAVTFETIDVSDDMPDHAKPDILEKPRFSGLVLVCDDNLMNQQVICDHLANVGLQTVVAENGKIGLEKVLDRVDKEEKPFDLIFMDIFMPVMDGLEAASKITALQTKTPIVALTANVMPNELEEYKKHGMPDCLGKPFTSQELWHTLLQYLTPESNDPIDEKKRTHADDALHKKLLLSFVQNNQTKYAEIAGAIAVGDIDLAHRLAHSLKGNAGFIGKTELQAIAAKVEALFKSGTLAIPEDSMNLLEAELASVLEELEPLLHAKLAAQKELASLDAEQVRALFEKLESMLKNNNPECVSLANTVRTVPGAAELARQIAGYDFEVAAETLDALKKQWQ